MAATLPLVIAVTQMPADHIAQCRAAHEQTCDVSIGPAPSPISLRYLGTKAIMFDCAQDCKRGNDGKQDDESDAGLQADLAISS